MMPETAIADLSRDELVARLIDAEETLRAIREGEVDAVVVQGANADQVFTLQGDGQSFRTFMEAMETGAAAFDSDGRLIYANQTLSELLGQSSSDLRSRGISENLDAVSRISFARLLSLGRTERHTAEMTISVGDDKRTFLLSAAPLEVGTTDGVALTFTDISDRDRAAAILESERLARSIIASANEAVIVCDAATNVTHVNAAGLRICKADPVGKPFEAAIALSLSDTSGIMSGADVVLMAAAGTPVRGIEASVKTGAADVTDLLVSAAPLTVAADRVQGCVVTLIDLSARKAAERRQSLLMAELDHRVKNTLAMVLAISARTAQHEHSIEGFKKAFSGRLQALAATHSLLSSAAWEKLSIAEILRAEIEPYVPVSSNRISIEGLDIEVDAQRAVSLGLIFHELTTNAVKYGSLSTQSGRLSVRAAGRTEGGRALSIEWRETGGPPVMPPVRSGFGKTLISRSLGEGAGGATLDFDLSGLVCSISVPL